MSAFSNLQKYDRPFSNDLVNNQGRCHHKEHREECQQEVEFSSENVFVRVFNEEPSHLGKVLLIKRLVSQEFFLGNSLLRG